MQGRRPEAGEPLGGMLLVPSVSLAEPSQLCSPGFPPSSPANCWMLLGPASHPYSALAVPPSGCCPFQWSSLGLFYRLQTSMCLVMSRSPSPSCFLSPQLHRNLCLPSEVCFSSSSLEPRNIVPFPHPTS